MLAEPRTHNLARYERIDPFYDLLDLPFERKRYQALRPLMFQNLGGRLLDAGIGTGRNCAFYPPDAVVSGIDTSPAMLFKQAAAKSAALPGPMVTRARRCGGQPTSD